jgi:hypothetical protein
LEADLGIEITNTVLTQSGGTHAYMQLPEKWQGVFGAQVNLDKLSITSPVLGAV